MKNTEFDTTGLLIEICLVRYILYVFLELQWSFIQIPMELRYA